MAQNLPVSDMTEDQAALELQRLALALAFILIKFNKNNIFKFFITYICNFIAHALHTRYI